MKTKRIDRAAFWEFKGRCAELDLELAKIRMAGEALTARRNALVDAFAAKHGLDAKRPLQLDDETLTVTQGE